MNVYRCALKDAGGVTRRILLIRAHSQTAALLEACAEIKRTPEITGVRICEVGEEPPVRAARAAE